LSIPALLQSSYTDAYTAYIMHWIDELLQRARENYIIIWGVLIALLIAYELRLFARLRQAFIKAVDALTTKPISTMLYEDFMQLALE